jgi:hypothetical protein
MILTITKKGSNNEGSKWDVTIILNKIPCTVSEYGIGGGITGKGLQGLVTVSSYNEGSTGAYYKLLNLTWNDTPDTKYYSLAVEILK